MFFIFGVSIITQILLEKKTYKHPEINFAHFFDFQERRNSFKDNVMQSQKQLLFIPFYIMNTIIPNNALEKD